MYETTEEEYKEFVKWLTHYRMLFRLVDWIIAPKWDDLNNPDTRAECSAYIDTHFAEVCLNKHADGPCSIRETALHEMVHVLLASSQQLGSRRFVDEDRLISEHERETIHVANIIRTLEEENDSDG